MTLREATEGFVRSFCRIKSRTYPYKPTLTQGLWVLRDDPPRNKERKIEVVSHNLGPAETVATIRQLSLPWHFVVAIHEREDAFDGIREAYKALGYRPLATEWMFVHEHDHLHDFDCEPPVREVDSPALLATIPQIAQQPRKLLPETRLYGIWDEQRDYGWVRSVPECKTGWASELFVYSEFRGRGYGRALMSRLLRGDRSAGLENSALIASAAGARLYPHLGYRRIAVLQIFCPLER